LKRIGYAVVDIEKGADVGIINTCAFVASAREESIDAILEAVALKKSGKIRNIIVCGCLPQLYKKQFANELSEVDAIVGTADFPDIPNIVAGLEAKGRTYEVSSIPDYLYDETSPRLLLTPKHYAYIKISEGCSNFCSYCIISRLRGRLRSRSVVSVVNEVELLSKDGRLKELNLVGQDTTVFGRDVYGKSRLADLVKRIAGLKNSVQWIRILYTHPAHYTDELIEAIASEDKVCKYLDIPIQHINDGILKRMNRMTSKRQIADLIARLKKEVPGIALRTSVIVGFPGETDKEFKELLRFLKEVRFDRLGAFAYSREPGTAAARFGKQVPEGVKKERLDEVMKMQQAISLERNKSFLGGRIKVLIDEKVSGTRNEYIGRTEFDAPDVDGVVYVNGESINVGNFYEVDIADTLEYDLVGKVA